MNARFLLSAVAVAGVCCLQGCESGRLFRRDSCCQSTGCASPFGGAPRKAEPPLGPPTEVKAVPAVLNPAKRRVDPAPLPVEEKRPSPSIPSRPQVPPLALPPVTSRFEEPIEVDLSLPIKTTIIREEKVESARETKFEPAKDERMIILDPEVGVNLAKNSAPSSTNTDITEAQFRLPKQDDAKDSIISTPVAHVQLGQLDNYRQITGKLVRWRNSWQLRYAPVEAEDPHGGSVVLESVNPTNNLRDGQIARVRGKLLPGTNRHSNAQYVVQSIELLD